MLDEYVPGAPRGKRLAATRGGYGCRSDGVEKGLERGGGGDEVVGTVATRSAAAAVAAAAVSVAMSVLCVGAVGAGKGTGSAR